MNDTIVSSAGGFTVIPEAAAKKQGIHNPPEALPPKAKLSQLTPEIAQSHPHLVACKKPLGPPVHVMTGSSRGLEPPLGLPYVRSVDPMKELRSLVEEVDSTSIGAGSGG